MRNVSDALLTGYAKRADFKFEIFDGFTVVNKLDSYVVAGDGIDTIDKVIAIVRTGDPRTDVVTDDSGNGPVLLLKLDDLVFLRAQYAALYGEVNKAPFNVPGI